MAVEARRGCGYRKVGGLYLVSDGRGVVCDRLPILLEVCPTCGHGIKQAWILFAHPRAIVTPLNCGQCNALLTPLRVDGELELLCYRCAWKAPAYRPGIFKVWRPQRIEFILPDSQRGSELAKDYEAKGITPVFVPDDDPDHRGTVYDDDEENGNGGSH